MTKTKIICSKASTCKAAKNCDHAKPHKGPCGPATQCHSDPDNEISTCIAVGGDINVDGLYIGHSLGTSCLSTGMQIPLHCADTMAISKTSMPVAIYEVTEVWTELILLGDKNNIGN